MRQTRYYLYYEEKKKTFDIEYSFPFTSKLLLAIISAFEIFKSIFPTKIIFVYFHTTQVVKVYIYSQFNHLIEVIIITVI